MRESTGGFLVIISREISSGDANLLRMYDSSWKLVKEEEFSEYRGRLFALQEDKDGDILWSDRSSIHICDKELEEKFELKAPEGGLGLFGLTSKGEFLIYTNDIERRIGDYSAVVVYDIDKEKKKVRKKYDLGVPWSGDLTSGYHANLYFRGPSNELCRYDQEQKTLTRIYGLSDVGIGQVSPYGGVLTGEDDTIILLASRIISEDGRVDSPDDLGPYEIVRLTPTDEVQQTKKEITLASNNASQELRNLVAGFNGRNEEYVIKLSDYSEEGGIDRLNADIVAGDVPDLIDTSTLPADTYVNKGILVDLNEFLQKDGELSEELFVDNVYDGMCRDGKLYEMISSFHIYSWIGKESLLGKGGELNLGGLEQLIDSKDVQTPIMTLGDPSPIEIMRDFCYMASRRFIDYGEGSSRFGDSEFQAILEFAKKNGKADFAVETDVVEMVVDEKALAFSSEFMVTPHAYIQIFNKLFKGDVAFHGFPTEEGATPVFIPRNGLAITTSCEEREVAWEFIRGMLTKEYQLGTLSGFPFRKDALEQLLAESQYTETTTTEDGRTVEPLEGEVTAGKYSAKMEPLSDEEVELCKNFVYSATERFQMDEVLQGIILEECESYFNSGKSAEEAAEVIQSRVQTLLDERK